MRTRFIVLLAGSLFGSQLHAASVESILSNVHLGWGAGALQLEGGDSAPGWNLIAGYELNPYISGELGYLVNSGDPFVTTKSITGGSEVSTASTHFWNVSAIGSWPFNDTYSVFGRAGLLSFGGSTIKTQGATATSSKLSSNELFYSLGGAISIDNGMLRLEYQQSSVLDRTVSFIELSAVWKLHK